MRPGKRCSKQPQTSRTRRSGNTSTPNSSNWGSNSPNRAPARSFCTSMGTKHTHNQQCHTNTATRGGYIKTASQYRPLSMTTDTTHTCAAAARAAFNSCTPTSSNNLFFSLALDHSSKPAFSVQKLHQPRLSQQAHAPEHENSWKFTHSKFGVGVVFVAVVCRGRHSFARWATGRVRVPRGASCVPRSVIHRSCVSCWQWGDCARVTDASCPARWFAVSRRHG